MSTYRISETRINKHRTCLSCGGISGLDFGTVKCPCGGFYDIRPCKTCGDIVLSQYLNKFVNCPRCIHAKCNHTIKGNNRLRSRRLAAAKALHNELVEAHNEAYSYLIEYGLTMKNINKYDWYRMVQHFDGCCFCDDGYADLQRLFIRPKDGGLYKGNNILPVCEDCRSILDKFDNPLVAMDARLNKHAPVDGLIRLQKVLRYMGYGI